MNFLYLSPHFPINYQAFCLQLSKLGVNLLGLADAPYDSLEPGLQTALREYYRVDDMHNYDQLVQACEYFTERYGKIDRLDSHAEYWLETEARLRSRFHVEGIQADTIEAMKRKSLMKEIFNQAGILTAKGQVCQTLDEALAFAKEVGFPIIAKPDIGVGAANTYKLENQEELTTFFDNPPSEDYIFEEFVQGELYSYDGLTNQEGELCFSSAHYFCKGIMDIVHNDEHIYYYSLRDIPKDLEAAGKKVLNAFQVKERFFHFEFFRRHTDQQLVALEVNMRPPGGWTTDMFNFANNFNIYQEWANIIVNNQFNASWSRPYHTVYVGRKNHYSYAHSHEAILDRYHSMVCHHHENPAIFVKALGHYGYILRSPDFTQILEMTDYCLKLEDS